TQEAANHPGVAATGHQGRASGGFTRDAALRPQAGYSGMPGLSDSIAARPESRDQGVKSGTTASDVLRAARLSCRKLDYRRPKTTPARVKFASIPFSLICARTG
ncbi:MAG: hypothetical protein ACO1RT_07915, partial [Planctomycetaceae bacterium]